MHPLGYDPDPSLHGEGSSTGRRRRIEDDHCSPAEKPLKRRRHVATVPPPPMLSPPSDTLLPIRLHFTFRPDDPSKTLSMTTTISPLPPLAPSQLASSSSPHKRPTFQPSPQHLRRPLVGGGKPRRGRGRGGAVATNARGGAAAAPRASRASRRATRSRRTSATPTTLESIAEESVALRAEIKRLGLSLRDVTADGNCLFRALADQVWGDQTRHAYVRQIVCDELARNEDELREFVAGFLIEGEEYGAYVDRMRGLGVYGSHIELMAATKVFKRSIRVVLAQTSYTVEYTGEPDEAIDDDDDAEMSKDPKDAEPDDATGPRRRTRASTAVAVESMPRGRPGHKLLWLALFSDAEHYESVRRQGPGSSSGPAEVPDSLAIPHERDQSEAARAERAESGSGRKRSAATDAAAARFIADGRVAQVIASLPPWHGVSDADAAQVLVRTDGDVSKTIDILFDQLDSDGDGDGDGDDSSGDSHSDTSASASGMLDYENRTPSSSPEDPTSGESRSTHTPDTPGMSVSPASTAPTSPLSNASEYSDKPSPPASDRVLRSATRSASSSSTPNRRPRRGAGKM